MRWNYGSGANVEGLTLNESMEKAKLNWEVASNIHTFGQFGEHTTTYLDVYRGDNNQFLGLYKNRMPVQNIDIVRRFKKLFDCAELEIETLGHYDSKTIFASARLSNYDMNLNNVGDISQCRIILTDSHESDTGFNAYVHTNRLVCTNGMSKKVTAKVGFVAHSSTGISNQKAHYLFAAAVRAISNERGIMEKLTTQNMSVEDAHVQLINSFGNPNKPIDKQPIMVKTCMELFTGQGKGSDMLTAYQSAYGLLQSVTEYYSHHTQQVANDARFMSILNGTYQKQITKFENQLVKVTA